MKTVFNPDVPMPEEIVTPLIVFAAHCSCEGIETTTEEYAVEFLTKRYGKEIAGLFRPEFMYQ